MQTAELLVEGMTCNNCATGVRRRLEKQGMEQVDVNFATGEVRFQNIPNLPITAIKESIEDLGYVIVQADEPNQKKKNF